MSADESARAIPPAVQPVSPSPVTPIANAPVRRVVRGRAVWVVSLAIVMVLLLVFPDKRSWVLIPTLAALSFVGRWLKTADDSQPFPKSITMDGWLVATAVVLLSFASLVDSESKSRASRRMTEQLERERIAREQQQQRLSATYYAHMHNNEQLRRQSEQIATRFGGFAASVQQLEPTVLNLVSRGPGGLEQLQKLIRMLFEKLDPLWIKSVEELRIQGFTLSADQVAAIDQERRDVQEALVSQWSAVEPQEAGKHAADAFGSLRNMATLYITFYRDRILLQISASEAPVKALIEEMQGITPTTSLAEAR